MMWRMRNLTLAFIGVANDSNDQQIALGRDPVHMPSLLVLQTRMAVPPSIPKIVSSASRCLVVLDIQLPPELEWQTIKVRLLPTT